MKDGSGFGNIDHISGGLNMIGGKVSLSIPASYLDEISARDRTCRDQTAYRGKAIDVGQNNIGQSVSGRVIGIGGSSFCLRA